MRTQRESTWGKGLALCSDNVRSIPGITPLLTLKHCQEKSLSPEPGMSK